MTQESMPASNTSLVEAEFVSYFTKLAASLGMAKSLGQIFGVLFCSPVPLSLDDITERLQISKGSASQGLSRLQRLGAVSSVYPPHERRTFFQAEQSLRRLFTLFIEKTVRPRLDENDLLLQRIESTFVEPIPEHLPQKLASLRSWNDNLRGLLPFVASLAFSKDEETSPPGES